MGRHVAVVSVPAVTRPPTVAASRRPQVAHEAQLVRSSTDVSRRRFTIAVVVGVAVMGVPMLWILWDLWSGSANPLRGVPYDNFYDLQARAMFQGRLSIPPGYMGIEAFVHDGRQYTYFGIFPSLLRMPLLLLTHRFDGELTAPSILLAWMATALTSSLMLWRLRILVRGQEVLGRAEAASYGLLMATVMGGSVILFLSATPFIYNEDFAWSVPLTIGSLFALLGVLERPSWGRVWASGILVLATNLDRTPTGYACVIAAGLIAGWFAFGRGGPENRRWTLPVLGVALVPFAVSCLVTYAKFGIPVGLPMADQAWAAVNAHRRYFLAANNGKAFSFAFLPSTAVAYLQPFGLHISGVFPFFTTPTAPAAWFNGAVLDQTYPTASIPATMPLLFLLTIWGAITAFRPRSIGLVRLTRIILLAAAAGTAGVLLWGYISERYMADFMPLLVIASGVGLIDIWRRLQGRGRRVREVVLGVIGVSAVFCIAVNMAISIAPESQWNTGQLATFESAQKALSFQSLSSTVRQGASLPSWAPAGQLFIAGDCGSRSGLYLSSGDTEKDVPGDLIQHSTWLPVEQGSSISNTIGFTFDQPVSASAGPTTLLTYGPSSLVLAPYGANQVQLKVLDSGTSISWPSATGQYFAVRPGRHYQLTATTDPNLKSIVVRMGGQTIIGHYLGGEGPAVVQTTSVVPGAPTPAVSVVRHRSPKSTMSLCRSLQNR